MRTSEILNLLPDIIQHKSHGYGELEILFDERDKKAVCYRYKDGTSSFATYGKTWEEVYESLGSFMEGDGKQVLDILPSM